jgi:hypothetical protein
MRAHVVGLVAAIVPVAGMTLRRRRSDAALLVGGFTAEISDSALLRREYLAAKCVINR